ncbi:MAG: Wzz/FepE/Etk N-terminal domain-containing protein [Verrucomicrobiota bacterium]
MNNSRQTQQPGGMTLGDIYYVLFRHKWKIILLSLAGILAAVALHFLNPPPYQSQAELLIQYVPQARSLSLVGSDQKMIMPDSRGDDIINSEIQILTSLDLAEEAVTNIGPANILARAGGGSNAIKAAALVRNSLQVEPAGKGSSVIVVTFKHPDPQIVQPVLQEIINDYFQKHYEIHSAVGQYDDALSRERSTLSVQLNDTEQQLANLKNKANIISLDDTRKGLADQISKIRGAILDAQAELAGYEAAGYEAAMKPVDKAPPLKVETTNAQPAIPSDQIDAYSDICTRLNRLRKKEQDYLVLQGFTVSNALVREVDGQIADTVKAKASLEGKYPQIAGMAATSPASGGQADASAVDLRTQVAQVAALQAKLKAWDAQLDQLQMQTTNLNSLAPTIAQLEQTKAIQEANYHNLATKVENSHIDEALGKAPNIKWVQMPSPPFRDWAKAYKLMAMVAFGGIFAGLAWAFLIELYLDHSVRRPVEIEAKLKLPLFLSIPDVSWNGHSLLAKTAERRQLRLHNATEDDAPAGGGDPSPGENGVLQVVSLERNPSLQPFYEALRDRLIVYFEVKNLTHKPKLVAVTSAGQGAGVSTIAGGLAASLSETGDGNVLLVNMSLEQGAAQQFYKGKASCGLDAALENATKEDALVQENLYVVTGNSNNNELPSVLPKRFAALVPKLKASDYDYIIFDMPPVSQTSITSRLARFMDMVLLVVESEKTDRGVVQQANTWLAESGATVGAVLNKTRQYVPERLHQEFLGNK